MELDELSPISPLQLFNCSYPVSPAKKLPEKGLFEEPFLLPCMADFLGERAFADVAIGWNELGLELAVQVDSGLKEDDAIELFIDTRDRKDLGSIGRFCHHFVFYPARASIVAEELTKLRAAEMRDLAPEGSFDLTIEEKRGSYIAHISILESALFGYDPNAFSRLGFTYLIKSGEKLQHFAVSSKDYVIASHPSLWASLVLKKSKGKV